MVLVIALHPLKIRPHYISSKTAVGKPLR